MTLVKLVLFLADVHCQLACVIQCFKKCVVVRQIIKLIVKYLNGVIGVLVINHVVEEPKQELVL